MPIKSRDVIGKGDGAGFNEDTPHTAIASMTSEQNVLHVFH